MIKKYVSELYHHGIEGQKWGQRNGPPYPLDRKESRAIAKRERKKKKEEIKKRKHIKNPKRLAKLSDEELEKAINRLTLERKYMDLVDSIDNNSGKQIKRESELKKASGNNSNNKKNKSSNFLVKAGKDAVSAMIVGAAKDSGTKALSYKVAQKFNKWEGSDVIYANTGNNKKEKEKDD